MAERYANGSNISTYHLAENPKLYEPTRNNAFEFLVPENITNILKAGVSTATASSDDYFTGADFQEVIRLSVSEAFVPHFNLGVIEVKRGNSTMKFAGTPSFDDGTLKLNDYVGARTKDYLLAWQNLAYNVKDDVVELASNYKFDCTLLEYTPDYSKVLRKWTLKGCWVKTLSEGSFSHESNDKRTVDVTVVYDRAIPEYGEE